jgi:hypothetical protein
MSTEWTEETIREHLFTEVEVRDRDDESPWRRATLRGFLSLDKTDHIFVIGTGHGCKYMRLITKPVKRLMTIKELWGKTLVSRNGCLVTVNKVDSHNQIKMLNSWNTVEEAHLNDWRLAGPDLDYETATSLEVDDE